ncbi:uncharacterized protein PHALS_15123 [Plasmopara halstedii]|uniref:Uncharacterized protein n=1 Tax=Plasmopara halstedii TaxID=4781 RepID=A0A0P1A666_PLAHL|nr:uncharacterized protein PHALS_15123 [Plasmopara halstedii]CEG35724.1 hypothetical protein PHALS_15123 [Plasmopara halstedii]|eukprot:XP_024572093.1 hypothetical protein PHALS_15123 [Plasmopara halstedii]
MEVVHEMPPAGPGPASDSGYYSVDPHLAKQLSNHFVEKSTQMHLDCSPCLSLRTKLESMATKAQRFTELLHRQGYVTGRRNNRSVVIMLAH